MRLGWAAMLCHVYEPRRVRLGWVAMLTDSEIMHGAARARKIDI